MAGTIRNRSKNEIAAMKMRETLVARLAKLNCSNNRPYVSYRTFNYGDNLMEWHC